MGRLPRVGRERSERGRLASNAADALPVATSSQFEYGWNGHSPCVPVRGACSESSPPRRNSTRSHPAAIRAAAFVPSELRRNRSTVRGRSF